MMKFILQIFVRSITGGHIWFSITNIRIKNIFCQKKFYNYFGLNVLSKSSNRKPNMYMYPRTKTDLGFESLTKDIFDTQHDLGQLLKTNRKLQASAWSICLLILMKLVLLLDIHVPSR